MNYNRYLRQSPAISEIGLGAWQLGVNSGWKSVSEPEAIGMVREALDMGINFIDTAPNYGHGTSESRIGKALDGIDRSRVVINTKFGHTAMGKNNYSSGYIRESLEGSLSRLRTDYVDSLLFHNPPAEYLDGNKNDHYEILERLVEEGKIRAYGASLDTAGEMKLLMGTTNCEVIEAFFNILHQDAANAFQMALKKQVAIIAKVPLDSGWLTGKYHAGSTFDDIRSRWSATDIQTRAALVDRVQKIIGEETDLVSAALSFCLAHEAVSTVIPGNTTLAQLRSNVQSTDRPLSKKVVQQLEAFYREEVEPRRIPW